MSPQLKQEVPMHENLMNLLNNFDINPFLIQKAGYDLETIMRLSGAPEEEIEKWGRFVVKKAVSQKNFAGTITDTIINTCYQAANAVIVKKYPETKTSWEINETGCRFFINEKPYLEFFKK